MCMYGVRYKMLCYIKDEYVVCGWFLRTLTHYSDKFVGDVYYSYISRSYILKDSGLVCVCRI